MSSLDMMYAMNRHREYEAPETEDAGLSVAHRVGARWWQPICEKLGDLLIVSGMKLKRQSAPRRLSPLAH